MTTPGWPYPERIDRSGAQVVSVPVTDPTATLFFSVPPKSEPVTAEEVRAIVREELSFADERRRILDEYARLTGGPRG